MRKPLQITMQHEGIIPLDYPASSSSNSFEIGPLLSALIRAHDWRACCTELAHLLPQYMPAVRVDVYIPGKEHSLDLAFSTHAPWPTARAIEGEQRIASWYGRLSYFWFAQPLVLAGNVYGWMVLARYNHQLEPNAKLAAEQLAPLLALHLRHEHAQQSLEQSNRHSAQLEQRLRTNDALMLHATLAAGTAHDLGNLFTSLLAHSQLLMQDAPEYLQKDLAAILRAAEDGRHLLHRLQSGVLRPEADTSAFADVGIVTGEAIDLTRPLWEARRNIQMRLNLPNALLVRIRPADLREVLVNLILNAIAAMPRGGDIVFAACINGEYVELSVTDNGSGIPADQQAQIFQPLVTTRAQGSGLGLSISRTLLELYEGTIGLESEPGKGTTFHITLLAAQRDRAVSEG